jgi:hypothetical protein
MHMNFFEQGKERIFGLATNLRGVSLRRKYVIFESDDWGMSRVPGLQCRQRLTDSGLDVTSSRYDLLDCLESRSDLEQLFNVLDRHRGNNGRAPRFTMNMILGNPDFEAIRQSNFEEYAFEDLFETYRRHHGENLQPVWERASTEGLIRPQFHGREHLNVDLWLHDLRAGHHDARIAFDHGYFGLETQTSSARQKHYLAAYWPTSASHFRSIMAIAEDGLDRFERLFGYRSRSFIACNYVLPGGLEAILGEKGVELIQGQRGQLCPSSDGSQLPIRRSYTGQRNRTRQLYSVRNVNFEPFEDPSRDWVTSAMREIKSAFFWRTPAIISTHRVNYASGMDIKNRDNNLKLLEMLLQNILRTWPDVEFVTSDELISIIDGGRIDH